MGNQSKTGVLHTQTAFYHPPRVFHSCITSAGLTPGGLDWASHVTAGKTEARRGEALCTKSHSKLVAGRGQAGNGEDSGMDSGDSAGQASAPPAPPGTIFRSCPEALEPTPTWNSSSLFGRGSSWWLCRRL